MKMINIILYELSLCDKGFSQVVIITTVYYMIKTDKERLHCYEEAFFRILHSNYKPAETRNFY